MTERMAQRNFSPLIVDAIVTMAEWNARGDRLVLDQRQDDEINAVIVELRRGRKQLDRLMKELDRLRKKGRVTIVTKEESLITVYRNTKRERA